MILADRLTVYKHGSSSACVSRASDRITEA